MKYLKFFTLSFCISCAALKDSESFKKSFGYQNDKEISSTQNSTKTDSTKPQKKPHKKVVTKRRTEKPKRPETISILGFKSVTVSFKDGWTILLFDPFIPRDDTAMDYTFYEIAKTLYGLNYKTDLVTRGLKEMPNGVKVLRYQYKSKTLLFLPMKNDDGTIHTTGVREET